MSVAGRLAVLALRPLAEGALEATGQAAGEAAVAPVAEFLTRTLTSHNAVLTEALRRALERAWKTVEVALRGGSWLRRSVTGAADTPIAGRLEGLVIETEAAMALRAAQRGPAVAELAAARGRNLLFMPAFPPEGMAAGLARGAALYARFDDFELLLKADRAAVTQIADELKQAGFANLAAVLLPDAGPPLLAVAARYFFRRAVQDDPQLAPALAFARFEELLPELQEALDGLHEVLTRHGRRLEELLGNAPPAPPAAAAPAARPAAITAAPVEEVIPVVLPVAGSAKPAARVARVAREEDEEYEEYVEPRRGGGKTLLVVFGVLALLLLLGCGGVGGALLYFWDDIRSAADGDQVAESGGGKTRANSTSPIPGTGHPAGGNRPAPAPAPEKKTHKLTVTGAPTPEVADLVLERIRTGGDDHGAPLIVNPRKSGNDMTVTLEEKFATNIDDWLRKLDLGAIERDGDDYRIALTPPPEPRRKPPDPPELPQLSPAQYQQVLGAFRTNKNVREALLLLQQTAPKDEQRSAVRSALKLLARDRGHQHEAVKALGQWGTPEDVPFLTGLDDGGPFSNEPVIKALGALRDVAAAPYLVTKLDNFFVGEQAADALRAIGPPAEKAVQSALGHKGRDARKRACRVLKEVGSTASVGVLKTATRDQDHEVAAAAWDALRTITYYPTKPHAAEPATPAARPKAVAMIDDLKVTTLEEDATAVAPNVGLAADGQGFYTLEPSGSVQRRDWDGNVVAATPARGMTLMAVSSRGLLLASAADAKIVDPQKLETRNAGELANAKWLTSGPELDFAVIRNEGPVPGMLVIDLGSFTVVTVYADREAGKLLVLPAGVPRNDPVLAPDGRSLFTAGDGRLQRWAVAAYKLTAGDSTGALGSGDGKVVVSPDGRLVTLLFRDGHKDTPGRTAVFAATDLKKPAFTVNHGPRASALAFDARGGVWVGTETQTLLRFDTEGKKLKEYALGGVPRQVIPDRDGKRLLVLTRDKLLRLDLP